MSSSSIIPLLFFAVSYGMAIFYKGWGVGAYTLAVGISALMLVELFGVTSRSRKVFAYLIFFITPFLTAIGQIGALTGFGRTSISLPWQGIAFATSGIAYQIYRGKFNFSHLFGSVMQPLRLISGPLAVSFTPSKKLNIPRIRIYSGWIILGAFFYGVLAAGIAPLLVLKYSAESVDILVFAVLFEIYVYLNFCGISLIVLGILNLIGVRTALNFNAPFSARSLIGYWQRWHISFAQVLKSLFFHPGRKVLGTSVAVIVVFFVSSMWHGVTLNFFIWGMFHAIGWLMAYYISRLEWGQIKKAINIFLMIVFIVVGRLIFSEDDSGLLMTKLSNLFAFAWNNDALALNMSLDTQAELTLGICFGIVFLEAFFPKKMFHYKMLRRDWILAILLASTLAYGEHGLGSVYGSR